ncbi:MAG: glycoside hydrolase family 88 protein [Phycisphaerae bacterium]|nr:glycoside hydrolase family 88 protein [Phycisphaerae bacterium]
MVLSLSVSSLGVERPLEEVVEESYAFAVQQYGGMLRALEGETRLPRTVDKGGLVLVGPRDWTSGFFPGSLWRIAEHTGDAQWRKAAADLTARVEPAKTYGGTHDLGFILYCSYGQAYRLTADPAYREVLLTGARTLCTRFNPKVGMIRSWDGRPWSYPVIIDNMMNLELLMFAHAQTREASFKEIAVRHANKTIENHFRPDGSSFHVVDFDPNTGAVLKRQTHQGFSDSSAWARGQSWGLYGFTMMYRFTQDPAYLAQARKVADFLIGHPRLPEDKIPYWDFDAPDMPREPRDASAGAVMCSALFELAGQVEADAASRYLAVARQQIRSLASPAYRAPLDGNGHFLLMHSVGHKGRGVEVDAPLVYADYYFLEAMARCKAGLGAG